MNLFLLLGGLNSNAQTDSLPSKLLNEVKIQDEHSNKQFNFYQSSKLASTEDILSRMDGVNLIRRGAFGMEPGLRNYSSGQINLSIDGMRIYGACTDKMDPVSIYIEPINLQGISASHGAQGNFFGSSIGGNINLKFKSPSTLCHTHYTTQLVQSYSTNNHAASTSFAFERAAPRSGFRISGAHRRANNYHAPDSVIKYSAFEKLNLSVSYQLVIDSGNQIRLTYLGDWGRNIGYPALPMDVGKANADIFSLTHYYASKFFKGFGTESKIYFNSILHQMDDTHREFVPMHMDMPGFSKTIGFYNELNFHKNKHGILARIDGHRNYMKSEMTMYPNDGSAPMYMETLPESYLYNLGLAIQYQLDLKANYFMKWNVRLDRFKRVISKGIGSDQWEGLGYKFTEPIQNNLKSLAWVNSYSFRKGLNTTMVLGYAERLPSGNELLGIYLFNAMDGFDYLGAPNLKPERSLQAEFQLKKDHKYIQWSAQLFYHQTRDLIYSKVLPDYFPMTIGAKGVKTYQNIGSAQMMGMEASIAWRIIENLQYRSSIKYLYAETQEGLPLPLVAPLKIQQSLRYQKFGAQWQLEHQYSAIQNRINPDFRERSTPEFHLWNIRVAKSIEIKKHIFQGSLALENMFNKCYHEHLDIGYIPRMGRNFTFTLGYILR